MAASKLLSSSSIRFKILKMTILIFELSPGRNSIVLSAQNMYAEYETLLDSHKKLEASHAALEIKVGQQGATMEQQGATIEQQQ